MFWLLLAFWVLLNGRITAEILILGVLICRGVYAACCQLLGYHWRRELELARRIPRMLRYLVILTWEIIKAAWQVMVLTVSPASKEVKPQLVRFKSPVRSEIGKVILSNSITLTPGTITCGLGDDLFCVHALDEQFAGGMDESIFVTEIRKLEEQ